MIQHCICYAHMWLALSVFLAKRLSRALLAAKKAEIGTQQVIIWMVWHCWLVEDPIQGNRQAIEKAGLE